MGFISVFYKVLQSHDINTLTEEKVQEYYDISLEELGELDILTNNTRYIKVKITKPKTVLDIDKLKIWAEENDYPGKLTRTGIKCWCRKYQIPYTKNLDGSGKYRPNIKLFYKLVKTDGEVEMEDIEEWTFPNEIYSDKIYDYYLTT